MENKFELVSSSFEEEEFYEQIEAPKFVDFTLPTHFCPDDRFWFCSRFGCDQKHEEEMDSEAIYKNFVLRVMAARSPNVRFRRAITRKPLSESKKCPLSAPPKTSKSRLPRLALVSSSISKKLIDPPEKVKPTSTPKARVKHVVAKYMTSPRMKKGSSPKPNTFRSVRNPVKTSISLPKGKLVAKVLMFNSPKKTLKKKKTPEEMGTPITKLCEGVKKLQINSQKKGGARIPSKDCKSERKRLPLESSRKILSSCKAKTREVEAEWSRSTKSKINMNCKKRGNVSRLEGEKHGDESSDMEIDEKSRCGSLEAAMVKNQETEDNHGSSDQEGTSSSVKAITVEKSDGVSSTCKKSEMNSDQDSDSSAQERTTVTEARNVNELGEDDKIKSGLVEGEASDEENTGEIYKHNVDEQCKDNAGIIGSNDIENQKPRVISECEEHEDKENSVNFVDGRNLNSENRNKHNASVKPKVKTKQNTEKTKTTVKENHLVAANTQVMKNKKLKTTNPKPFRLRTDERGILKEAISDRKNHSTPSENSQETEYGVTENRRKKDESRSLKKDQLKTINSRYNASKKVEPKSEKSLNTKSPFLHYAGPQRKHDSVIKSRGLCANGKTEITMSRLKDSRKHGKEEDDPTIRNVSAAARKLAAQRNKTGTIPREQKFHSLHKPTNCSATKS